MVLNESPGTAKSGPRDERAAARPSRQPRRSPFDEWMADNAEVVAFLTAEDFDPEGSRYLAQMAAKLSRRQPLTPNEVAAVGRNIVRRVDREQRLAEICAPVGRPAPSGRVVVEGTVREVAIRPGFRAGVPDRKMLVDCGDYRVWCTVPEALVCRPDADDLGLDGARVRFAATLAPRADNPSIAVGKAPRGAALISPAAHSDQLADQPASQVA